MTRILPLGLTVLSLAAMPAGAEDLAGRPALPQSPAAHAAEAPSAGALGAVPIVRASRTVVEPPEASPPLPAGVSGEMTGSLETPAADGHAAPAAAADAHAGSAAPGDHPAEGWTTARAPMPYDIIRTLQFLQDQIARGNGRAIRIQAMLLRRFAPVFAGAPADVWAQERNRRAALLFVLSGGPPEVLQRLLAANVYPEGERPLVEGALAYVQNDLIKAESLLAKVDLATLEPGLAAHLNLVIGQLKQNSHPKDAVAYLDQARLLAPGGLIEEAALRLEVMIVDGLGDHETTDRLARQYFDRYSGSSYAANFAARFAAVYAPRGSGDAQAALDTMLDLTARLPNEARRGLFLAVSRRALVEGHFAFARLAGDAALQIEGIDEADAQRGNLYAAAASAASPTPGTVIHGLDGIDRAKLHPEDLKLLEAAASVAQGIDGAVPPVDPSAPGEDLASSPVFDRAQALLDAVAGDLKKGSP